MQNFNAAVRAAMQLDGQMYNAIREAYNREQFDENGDEIDRHAYGLIAAVNAVYNLGHAAGFKAGAEFERSGRAEQISKEAAEATHDRPEGQKGQ